MIFLCFSQELYLRFNHTVSPRVTLYKSN